MCRGVGYYCEDVETEEGLPTLHIDARDYPMAEAIQRVRELHTMKPTYNLEGVQQGAYCTHCKLVFTEVNAKCDTLKALDGEQE